MSIAEFGTKTRAKKYARKKAKTHHVVGPKRIVSYTVLVGKRKTTTKMSHKKHRKAKRRSTDMRWF